MNVRVPGEGGKNLGWFSELLSINIYNYWIIYICSMVVEKLNNSIEGQNNGNRPILIIHQEDQLEV